jgi:ElaB/YqjD/DUF883 family membrane-anchored ribosome-binding protein
MKNNKDTAHTPKELLAELQTLVTEAETMIGSSLSEHSEDAMSALRTRYAAAQERMGELYDGAKKRVAAGGDGDGLVGIGADGLVGVFGAGVGLLVGVLLGRRSK